ncbi:MAG: class I SAM-dependent methyltransferase [Betaproteobacteria bacterium]|nr:class I SAM-dependent methyltransferase [Betaproteobacteria bacterium]
MDKVFAGLVTRGTLTVTAADGQRFTFGDGSGLPVAVAFADRGAQLAFMLDPELRLGELFMEERFKVEQGTIYDFLDLVLRENAGEPDPLWAKALDRIRFYLRRLTSLIGRSAAQANVAHHYDLDHRLFRLFLDDDNQYSCAYYEAPEDSLETAQLAKMRHIAAKLHIRPQDRILDIGCGWGGLARYLSNVAGAAHVTGITLSREQLALARQRAAASQISDRLNFELTDYRDMAGTFERIVSVGMFEHVGFASYATFFRKCRTLLAEDGVMLLHTIGQCDGPNAPNPWLTKYIFPGGYLPALSEMLPAIERAGLIVSDIEVLRLHYATTLRQWRERFMARRDAAKALYDERFCRMWEFYLAMCEAAFHHQNVAVFQLQLVRRQTAAPLTREYIGIRETELRAAEASVEPRR